MNYLMNHPFALMPGGLAVLWLAARLGVRLGRWRDGLHAGTPPRESLDVIVGATLTLLSLIVSFTFSMATTRYDLRRLYEEQEANAIGTEYVRAALLPPQQAGEIRTLMTQYLGKRIEFYEADDRSALPKIDAPTMLLQAQLWAAVQPQAAAAPNPVTALVVSGMNDVLNAQGYTQFAWWNRIPTTAWSLAIFIAVLANLLVGYSARKTKDQPLLLLVLPLLVSVSFVLVADIDSPRGGVIRVHPQNLKSLASSLAKSGVSR